MNKTPVNSLIKLVIADDHDVVRTGLVSYLGRYPEHFEFLGEAKTGYKALMLCEQLRPSILLLDLNMPGEMNGYEVIGAVRNFSFYVKILVLTGEKFSEDHCLGLGADMWVDKNSTNEAIRQAIEELARRSISNIVKSKFSFLPEDDLPPYTYKAGTNTSSKSELKPPIQVLSRQELAVLSLAAKDCDKNEIAEQLNISPGTVKVHLNRIYQKLGVHRLSGAIYFAQRNGLLSDDYLAE